jgi:hypothetical protein
VSSANKGPKKTAPARGIAEVVEVVIVTPVGGDWRGLIIVSRIFGPVTVAKSDHRGLCPQRVYASRRRTVAFSSPRWVRYRKDNGLGTLRSGVSTFLRQKLVRATALSPGRTDGASRIAAADAAASA